MEVEEEAAELVRHSQAVRQFPAQAEVEAAGQRHRRRLILPARWAASRAWRNLMLRLAVQPLVLAQMETPVLTAGALRSALRAQAAVVAVHLL